MLPRDDDFGPRGGSRARAYAALAREELTP
jgi:hypothetical protein